MAEEPEVIRRMRGFKRRLLAEEQAAMQQMAAAWLIIERRMQDRIELAARELADAKADGRPVQVSTLFDLQRYQALVLQVRQEIEQLADRLGPAMVEYQRTKLRQGVEDSILVLRDMTGRVGFDILPVQAVQFQVGYAADGSPLAELMKQGWPDAVQHLTNALLRGTAEGRNPREVAMEMRQGATAGLQRMMNVARTEGLRAYRESSRQTYQESGVVVVYKRLATRDSRVCPACLADDGQPYELHEPLPEHPSGRCTLVPVVEGMPPVIWQSGEAWLRDQSPEVQRGILGAGRWELWRTGQISLRDVATIVPSSVWGPSLQPTPLRALTQGVASSPSMPEASPLPPTPEPEPSTTVVPQPAEETIALDTGRN